MAKRSSKKRPREEESSDSEVPESSNPTTSTHADIENEEGSDLGGDSDSGLDGLLAKYSEGLDGLKLDGEDVLVGGSGRGTKKEAGEYRNDGVSEDEYGEDDDEMDLGDLKDAFPQASASDDGSAESDDSIDALVAELDEHEKALKRREAALNRGKGEHRRLVAEEGLENLCITKGGVKALVAASLSDEEEQDDQTMIDKELEDRLLNLSRREKEHVDAIAEFEHSLMHKDKSWTMKGEVSASMRPKDSLLEVDVEIPTYAQPRQFEYEDTLAAEQAAAGDETALALEGTDEFEEMINVIIRRRIHETTFDDVEAKNLEDVMPVSKTKEDEVLEFTKSKLGLAEIYDETFKEKVLKLPTERKTKDDHKRAEIADEVVEILTILDNLSNDHHAARSRYTKQGFNLLQTEAAPLSLRSKGNEAPEELAAPDHENTDKSTMTKDERRALRRATKQRKKKLKIE